MKKICEKMIGVFCCFIGMLVLVLGLSIMEAQANPLGDVNKDFKVNATDALLVLQKAAGMTELNRSEVLFADVNYDEVVNADDALEILQVAAGIGAFNECIELGVGQFHDIMYVIDTYDNVWEAEISTDTGVSVEKQSAGDTGYEKPHHFRITANELGTYTLTLINRDVRTREVLEVVRYTVKVEIPIIRIYPEETYHLGNIRDTEEAYWEYDVSGSACGEPDGAEGIQVECWVQEVWPGINNYHITAKEPGEYHLTLTLRNRENPDEIIREVNYIIRVESMTRELAVGETVEFDHIWDQGAYMWEYEVSSEMGITVERIHVQEPFDDYLIWYEQVYKVTANEPGTYTITLKLTHVGTDDDILETKVFTIYVK